MASTNLSLPKNQLQVKPNVFVKHTIGNEFPIEGHFCNRCLKTHPFGKGPDFWKFCEVITPDLPSGHFYFKDPLKEEWARLIHWAIRVFPKEDVWWCSHTFKREVSYTKAFRCAKEWMGRLSKGYKDSNKTKVSRRLRFIRALAYQVRGVIHFHHLICAEDLDLLSRQSWEFRWERMDWNMGTCRIYLSSRDKEKARYLVSDVLENVSKRGDLTWGGDWRGLKAPYALGTMANLPRCI